MKTLLLTLFVSGSLYAQYVTPGERIEYKIHYGFVTAGKLTVQADSEPRLVDGKYCLRVRVEGKTTGAIGAVTDILDVWETCLDTASHKPYRFDRKLKENKYYKDESTVFDRVNNKAIVSDVKNEGDYKMDTYTITPETQDMISAFYYLRNLEVDRMRKGDILTFPVFLEDSLYNIQVRFLGRDRIRTSAGKFKAWKLSPIMPENSVFDEKESIVAWVSDDEDRIPLKLKAKLLVGAAELDIVSHSSGRIGKKKR